jgi:hypothetical protein
VRLGMLLSLRWWVVERLRGVSGRQRGRKGTARALCGGGALMVTSYRCFCFQLNGCGLKGYAAGGCAGFWSW